MFNPFTFSLMVLNFQMEMTQRLLFAGFAPPKPRVQLNLVAVNHWRLPQRSRATLTLVH